MLMTEEQARTKWCPKARQTDGDHPTYNRMEDGSASDSCLCIASGCMAWRWAEVEPQRGFRVFRDNPASESSEQAIHRPDDIPASWEWRPAGISDEGDRYSAGFQEPLSEAKARRRGFCGAFGKAEG